MRSIVRESTCAQSYEEEEENEERKSEIKSTEIKNNAMFRIFSPYKVFIRAYMYAHVKAKFN